MSLELLKCDTIENAIKYLKNQKKDYLKYLMQNHIRFNHLSNSFYKKTRKNELITLIVEVL